MNNNLIKNSNRKHQKGATLIVSLVILTVVTILGLASMRNSNLELKMAASARDRGVAFQNAESALRLVEDTLSLGNTYSYNQLSGKCGTGPNCFNQSCINGLCFTGDFSDDPRDCTVTVDNLPLVQMWKANVWDTPATYQVLDIPNSDSKNNLPNNEVKYVVEFMCFVEKETKAVVGGDPIMLPLFRITVRAEGEAGRSSVMLQTVFKSSEV